MRQREIKAQVDGAENYITWLLSEFMTFRIKNMYQGLSACVTQKTQLVRIASNDRQSWRYGGGYGVKNKLFSNSKQIHDLFITKSYEKYHQRGPGQRKENDTFCLFPNLKMTWRAVQKPQNLY